MEAIILAGGFGTRLQSVVSDVPKPMAPINGKPFLEYILLYLKKYGIDKVILAVSYKKDIIKNYFKDSFYGIKIRYSEENEPLGTGGAIKQALDLAINRHVYVFNGDTFFDFDIRKMNLRNSCIQIALKKINNSSRYGVVKINNGIVSEFCEKIYEECGFINCGTYLLSKDLFTGFKLEKYFSFEYFLAKYVNELNIETIIDDGYFIDIGIPEDYYYFCNTYNSY